MRKRSSCSGWQGGRVAQLPAQPLSKIPTNDSLLALFSLSLVLPLHCPPPHTLLNTLGAITHILSQGTTHLETKPYARNWEHTLYATERVRLKCIRASPCKRDNRPRIARRLRSLTKPRHYSVLKRGCPHKLGRAVSSYVRMLYMCTALRSRRLHVCT